jgi:DNA-binding LacI/PurR family transcriptional regulator
MPLPVVLRQRLRGVAGALRNTGYDLVVYNVDTAEHARNFLQSLPISQRLDGC